jgi:hypothetical protein
VSVTDCSDSQVGHTHCGSNGKMARARDPTTGTPLGSSFAGHGDR